MKKIFKGKHGPLLIAEIGGNHEGNFEYAKKLTQLAIDSDVDIVKFQISVGVRADVLFFIILLLFGI